MKRPKSLVGKVLIEWEIKAQDTRKSFLKILPLAIISLILVFLFFAIKENSKESWVVLGVVFIFFVLAILILGLKKGKPTYYGLTTAGAYGYQKESARFLRWSELSYFYKKRAQSKDGAETFILVQKHKQGPWFDFFRFITLRTRAENNKKVKDILLQHLEYKLPNVREFYAVVLLFAIVIIILLAVYLFVKWQLL